MELKVKWLGLNAGKPVVMIHEDDAKVLNLRPSEHVLLSAHNRTETAVVDSVRDFIKKGQVAISKDLASRLDLVEGSLVEVKPSHMSQGSTLLRQRLVCKPYTKSDLKKIIKDIVNNNLTEAEVAYFISGVHYCGMSLKEVYSLIEAIVDTGQRLKWKNRIVADKHSIGGIPGNRTTPILVAICAAAGIVMPKTSSRAITSAAGTADTIETLTHVDFSAKKLKKIVEKTGACLAWGGSLGLAPADDKLIQIEKILNIDPEPQLLASILAKKVAVGSKYVLIDIPFGPGAKVTKKESYELEKKFKQLAKWLHIKLEVIRTDGSQPVGNGIGPALEMVDVLKVLQRTPDAPKDLERHAVNLAATLLEMVGKAKKGKGATLAQKILDEKKAYHKFEEIIKAQGGMIKELPKAKHSAVVRSAKTGKITSVDNRKTNSIARILGCPYDKAAGIYLHYHVKDKVKKGDIMMTLYSESPYKLQEAIEAYRLNTPIRVE